LLKRQTQQIAKPFLAHANQHPANTHAVADLDIDGVGLFFSHALLEQCGRAELAPSVIQRKQLISPR
jgi:hypothetical protein